MPDSARTHGIFSLSTQKKLAAKGFSSLKILFAGDLEQCLLFLAEATKTNRLLFDDLKLVEFLPRGRTKEIAFSVKQLMELDK